MDKQLKMTLRTSGNLAFNNNQKKKSYLDSQRVVEQCSVCSVQNAQSWIVSNSLSARSLWDKAMFCSI